MLLLFSSITISVVPAFWYVKLNYMKYLFFPLCFIALKHGL